MDGSVLEEKSFFKMLGLTFSSKLDCGSYIICIAKTASRKIGALICSMKFHSLDVALHLYKSTIQSCMEYCHVWAGAPSCYLELLDKLQKWICRTVGPLPAASLEPLDHHWNITSISTTLVDVLLKWLKQFHFLILVGGLIIILIDCIIFCYYSQVLNDVYVNSFFQQADRLWNSLPIECFPLIYDLNGFQSTINSSTFKL